MSFGLDCVFGFTLYDRSFFGFVFNGIRNMEEDLILSFVCLAVFHLSGKPWAKG
jgi:hypothetical protein